MKNLPGYGQDAPIMNGVKYEFHDSEVFKQYYADRTTNNKRDTSSPRLKDDRPQKMRVADALVVNPSATLGNMRFKIFFDQSTCPGANCGHCDSVGQTVNTFESGATVTCTQDDVLTTTKKNYVLDYLMPGAAEFLHNALRINPVSGNLVVNPGGSCGGSPGTPIPAAHSTTGVPDADFIIYVTAAPKSDPNALTVAWALSCRRDGANRPVVAHVNFVPRRLTNAAKLDKIEIQSDIMTAIHEISHSLGFASPFFDGSGYYDESYTFHPGTGMTNVPSGPPFNKARSFITSPRVVREVRDFFNCPTAVGAEIEDQGGAGTAGSHWEKRIYQQHVMAGIGTTVAASPSRMLLAYFEDYGHYVANYSAVDSDPRFYISYGRGKGCDFIDKKCDAPTNKASGEFCFETDQNKKFCTFDGLAMGYCSASTFGSAVAAQFQYFTNPNVGSSIQLDDYCPSALFYSNQRCVDITTQTGVNAGESFGSSSRCFQSNLLSGSGGGLFGSGSSQQQQGAAADEARCFQTICNKDGSMSIVIDLRIVNCPADGSGGFADTSGLAGYSGQVICPPARRFCPSVAGLNGTFTYQDLPLLTPSTEGTSTSGFAPAFASPIAASCSARRQCAQAIFNSKMPACKEVAFEIARCFGTDCDEAMTLFVKTVTGSNCSSGRNNFVSICQEGKSGVTALCGLASAGKILGGALVLFASTLLMVLLL